MAQEDQEAKLLESLYDRLFDAITYTPAGKTSANAKETSYFQMCKNMVLNPADYADMMNPGNPGGDYTTAQLFSAFVDAIPTNGTLWVDSGSKVSDFVVDIMANANATTDPDPNQVAKYDQAFGFLNESKEVKAWDDTVTIQNQPSSIVINYNNNEAAYIGAVGGYRTAYNGYDLTDKDDQRAWAAVEPGLNVVVNQTWNKWGMEGKAQVEEARAVLASTINDAVRHIIEQVKANVAPGKFLPPAEGSTGAAWLPSYALPSNWATPASEASNLHFQSTYLNKTSSAESMSYSASASGSWGLWHASGGVSGSSEERHAHMDANDLTVDAELIYVQIKRPWLNMLLFEMNKWSVSGQAAGYIANAVVSELKGQMPILPTGFVVGRNVKITANFSESDESFMKETIETKASGGWGPFSVSGSYSHSKEETEYTATTGGGSVTLPGLQVLAFVSAVVPYSPPEAG
jgi:hypothetical protein